MRAYKPHLTLFFRECLQAAPLQSTWIFRKRSQENPQYHPTIRGLRRLALMAGKVDELEALLLAKRRVRGSTRVTRRDIKRMLQGTVAEVVLNLSQYVVPPIWINFDLTAKAPTKELYNRALELMANYPYFAKRFGLFLPDFVSLVEGLYESDAFPIWEPTLRTPQTDWERQKVSQYLENLTQPKPTVARRLFPEYE